MRFRAILSGWTLALILTTLAPVSAAAAGTDFPLRNDDQLATQFASGSLGGTSPITALPVITGSDEIDARIRARAGARGYVPRPLASASLQQVDGQLLQPEAAAAWEQLQAAARVAGHRIRLVAGFRDLDTQRSLFLRRLRGHSDAAIDSTLKWSAPPGFSKHHTGYAIDITESGSGAGQFGGSAAYTWLASDNYLNAKRFGFIPSYPADATPAGPEPEPWEWIYIGVEDLTCPGRNGCPIEGQSPSFMPI